MTFIDTEVRRGTDTDARAAFRALLELRLERDGEVTPTLAECPAAEDLVERGSAVWVSCLTLGRPK